MSCTYLNGVDVMRWTRLDNCGRPICAVDSSYVTSCAASLNITANTDDGDEIEYKSSRGEICAYLQRCPIFKNFTVEAEVLFASPELIEIATNSNVVHDYSGAVVGVDSGNVQCQGFAFEAWINTLGQECAANAPGEWLYILIPWITGGVLGDLEIADANTNFTLSGNTRSGGGWGTGPYNVVAQDAANTPGRMLTPLAATDHRRIQLTTIAPPTPSCDYVPVTGCLSS